MSSAVVIDTPEEKWEAVVRWWQDDKSRFLDDDEDEDEDKEMCFGEAYVDMRVVSHKVSRLNPPIMYDKVEGFIPDDAKTFSGSITVEISRKTSRNKTKMGKFIVPEHQIEEGPYDVYDNVATLEVGDGHLGDGVAGAWLHYTRDLPRRFTRIVACLRVG